MFAASAFRRFNKVPEVLKFSTLSENIRAKFGSNIPLYGAIIGTSAFTFQIIALYPWHDVLFNQMGGLRDHVANMNKASASLKATMERVGTLQEEIKIKERKALEKNDEILGNVEQMSNKLNELMV